VSKTLATAAVRVNIYFALLVFLFVAFLAVFSYGTVRSAPVVWLFLSDIAHQVFLSSGFELSCLILTQLLVVFLTVYQVSYPNLESDPAWAVQLAFSIVAFLATVVCGVLLVRREGRAVFERAALGERSIVVMVRDHELAITLLKLDLMMSLAIVIESGLFKQIRPFQRPAF
jgi:hypothetical protein